MPVVRSTRFEGSSGLGDSKVGRLRWPTSVPSRKFLHVDFIVNVNHHLMRWIARPLSSLRRNGLLHRVRPCSVVRKRGLIYTSGWVSPGIHKSRGMSDNDCGTCQAGLNVRPSKYMSQRAFKHALQATPVMQANAVVADRGRSTRKSDGCDRWRQHSRPNAPPCCSLPRLPRLPSGSRCHQ